MRSRRQEAKLPMTNAQWPIVSIGWGSVPNTMRRRDQQVKLAMTNEQLTMTKELKAESRPVPMGSVVERDGVFGKS